MLAGILIMGFTVSLLINVNLGMDPYTFLNVQLSARTGIPFGTCELLVNGSIFFLVLWKGRENIGLGTLFNMFFIGYIADFFRWVWHRTVPEAAFTQMPSRAVIFAITLAVFLIGVGLYMNASMGVSPYDAIPIMISRHVNYLPFAAIRMIFDFSVIFIGCLLGGIPTIGNILMAIFLGPVAGFIGSKMRKFL